MVVGGANMEDFFIRGDMLDERFLIQERADGGNDVVCSGIII